MRKPLSLLVLGWLIWFPLTLISALPFSRGWIFGTVLALRAGATLRCSAAPGDAGGARARCGAPPQLCGADRGALRRRLRPHGLGADVHPCRGGYREVHGCGVPLGDLARAASAAARSLAQRPPINYYYFGHYLMALFAKVLATQPAVAFNVAVALTFALAATAIFGVATNLAAARPGSGLRGAWIAGLASVALVLVLGDLAGAQSWWNTALARRWSSIRCSPTPGQLWLHRALWAQYDWWAPSRVIPNTISEFPAFSFVLADLHAHVLALPFVTLGVGIASESLARDGMGLRAFGGGQAGWVTLGVAGGALGALYAINGWDLPTYLGLALLALAIQQWLAHERRHGCAYAARLRRVGGRLDGDRHAGISAVLRGLRLTVARDRLRAASARSPLADVVAIFGLPAFILLSFVVVRLARWRGAFVVTAATAGLLLLTQATGGFGGWTLLWGLGIVAACASWRCAARHPGPCAPSYDAPVGMPGARDDAAGAHRARDRAPLHDPLARPHTAHRADAARPRGGLRVLPGRHRRGAGRSLRVDLPARCLRRRHRLPYEYRLQALLSGVAARGAGGGASDGVAVRRAPCVP